MKVLLKNLLGVAFATLFALAFSLSLFAFAEEDPDGVGADVASTTFAVSSEEQEMQDIDAATEAPSAGQTTEETIPDTEIPLIVRPYETGWSVVNLIASLLTIAIGVTLVILSVIHRGDKTRSSNSFGLAIFGMVAAILSTILFTSTEEIQSKMLVIDGFTVAHLAVLAVAVLCAVLTMKKGAEASQSNDTSHTP
ncbi:MAG: hypothetical protein LBK67_09225 [Coriobacteriales bacterium]|jgi:hypothetical protein|nr:hypothetical protein [Coriobacteriales bacterium]